MSISQISDPQNPLLGLENSMLGGTYANGLTGSMDPSQNALGSMMAMCQGSGSCQGLGGQDGVAMQTPPQGSQGSQQHHHHHHSEAQGAQGAIS